MTLKYCLVFAPLAVFVAQAVGCSSEFTSCLESRTCAPTGGGGGGGAGEAGEGGAFEGAGAAGETGGAGAAGAKNEGGAAGDVGVGGAPGEGGAAAGENGNDCAVGFKPCGAGKCIPQANCCSAAECTETCTTCSSTGACVAVKNADDLDTCAGTCDAAGLCKSKRGQSCQTAANGCISGTTCAPDGYCCNTACTESCQACDLTGFEGTCTPVASGHPHGNRTSCGTDATCAGTCSGRADGKCDFPTSSCGSGQTCAGTNSVGPAKCTNGSCVTPAPQTCGGNFACVGNACKTSCSADSDCLTGTFCQGGTCHRAAVQVAVGGNFACAVLNDGSVMCWGGSASRQLGPGGPTTGGNLALSSVPIKVTGLGSVKLIAAGASHVCALLTSGGVSCWGDANYGQLGPAVLPSAYNSATPVAVSGLPSGVTALSSGANTTCALVGASGAVYCWGDNIYGELGTNAPAGNLSPTPVKIADLGVATSVAVANTGCAIVGGGLACWGGDGGATPNFISGLAGIGSVQAVSASPNIFCAALAGGGVYSWGWNVRGGLGNPGVDLGTHTEPVQVQGLSSGALQVASGAFFACALLSNGKVSCWGDQRHGALGDGVLAPSDNSGGGFSRSAVQVSNLTGVKSISVDGSACALLNNGSVQCWGEGLFGQLGNSASADSSVPIPVTGW